jgi:DNA-binding SARP family transcriptional activator
MRYGILGPLLVSAGEAQHTPTAPKQRSLLALFLAQANRLVPADDIIAELWPDRPPVSAAITVQTYVMQLRARLTRAFTDGRAGREVLVTRPTGYLFKTEPGQLDVPDFERAAAAGMAALDLGDARGAAQQLRHAMSLWRGPALGDVRRGAQLDLHARRLDERRLHVEELCVDVELQMGRHREVIGDLRALVGRHPMHEGFHAKLMLALSRANRRTDALTVYRQLHEHLGAHARVEPSEAVRQLREAIAVDSPALGFGPSWSAAAARPRRAS